MDKKERERLFQNPTKEYRGKPFWAWNGKLEKEELLKQISFMKQMGFGGYFMHSRTGLETEYLGDEWFELTNQCADFGKQLGMESWLYDEDRWPSGIAGGMVTKDKRFRASFLKVEIYGEGEEKNAVWDETVQAVFLCRKHGTTVSQLRRCSGIVPVGRGEHLLVFRVEEAPLREVYNGYTYLDTMNREGTEAFLRQTHEQYRIHCGARLGDSIRGIFTDEPHRGPLFSTFSDGGDDRIPYTPRLWEEFEARFGYDLREYLPELFFRKEGEKIAKPAWDYVECCQELFLEGFAVPIQEWCRENHMIFTGHVLHEDSLTAQTVMQGSLMRFYAHMDYPGVDVLAMGGGCWWIVKQVASVARQLDKPWILSELYGCTGWQMSFRDYKFLGDWQALLGVNVRCPHLSWYTMKGEAKRDFPASIFYQSAWAKDYAYLEDYFSRIHVFLMGGRPRCGLLVLCPVESVWCYARSGAFRGLSAVDPDIVRLENMYETVFRILMEAHIDFDYGDEGILKEYGTPVEGGLKVGQCVYKKVLVAGMDTIRASTMALLETCRSMGCQVIFAGDPPTHVDAVASLGPKAMAEQGDWILLEPKAIAEQCAFGGEVAIEGEGSRHIFVQERQTEDARRIMLLNMDSQKSWNQVGICLGKGEGLTCFDARTGAVFTPEYEKKDGQIYVKTDMAAGEERLYEVSIRDADEGRRIGRMEKAEEEWEEISFPEEYAYEWSEPNVCVLDRVSIWKGEENWIEPMEVLKADRQFRARQNLPYRSGSMLQPWYQLKQTAEREGEEVLLRYLFQVEQIPRSCTLAVEDLEHIRRIEVNGEMIFDSSRFHIRGGEGWLDPCFSTLRLTDTCLRQGENQIDIWYDYHLIGGIEAVYLLGDFGVRLNQEGNMPYLTSLPETVRIGDLSQQGFPFYSGAITYRMPEGWGANGGDGPWEVTVHVEGFCGALVKLLGDIDERIAFPPYTGTVKNLRGMELVLTRRNTFGPLHQVPAVVQSYGPDNFLTEGTEWSERYMLLPQGLMKRPTGKRKRQ